jgi:DNA-binding transcriptional LysR family regulator
MELRQLRYFVAVAEELHYGRAAERLHISGPALSQQIIALERELDGELLLRTRRSVQLTPAGRSFLRDSRQILDLADRAARRVRQRAAETVTLRLGYVSWLPDVLTAGVGPVALRVDDWVLPSHAQADRVADGSLDLALALITEEDATARGLAAHLIRAEPLHALCPGLTSDQPVPADRVTVLIDTDESAWSSWNRFAAGFAAAARAPVRRITDGGLAGDAFFGHVRRIGGPVLASPKRHTAPVPPNLGQRPVSDPVPLWTWSLLHRADDDRPGVRRSVENLRAFARGQGWTRPPDTRWWVPDDDPHRAELAAPPGP